MVCLMLLYRSVESLRRNLTNLTLMKVGGFPLAADQEARVRVSSKRAFSRFRKLLKRMEFEHGAMCALFYHNRSLGVGMSGFHTNSPKTIERIWISRVLLISNYLIKTIS